MDITPLIPSDRQVIDSYGPGLIRVARVPYHGAILVFPDATRLWPIAAGAAVPDDLTIEDFAPVLERAAEVEVLLLGCGPGLRPLPKALRAELRAAGIVVDPMDTGAACRTYNVLLAEARRVAAALVPLPALARPPSPPGPGAT